MRFAPILLLVLASTASAQASPQAQPAAAVASQKVASATRIRDGVVRLDGKLDEAIWQTATPIGDFVQKEPVENAKPTDNLEVRFLYDDDALYVATRVTKSALA